MRLDIIAGWMHEGVARSMAGAGGGATYGAAPLHLTATMTGRTQPRLLALRRSARGIRVPAPRLGGSKVPPAFSFGRNRPLARQP